MSEQFDAIRDPRHQSASLPGEARVEQVRNPVAQTGTETLPSAGRGRELRLALVCYGGVSLAVYMHGVTKELRKLVAASRAVESGVNNPFAAGRDTEHVYFEELAKQDGEGPLRVVVDVITGTSAGGINGVVLAKAIAGNLNDDALLDVWRDKGDIAGLLAGPGWLPVRLRAVWFGFRLLGKPSATPLRGDQMARWLYDTMDAMDTTAEPRDFQPADLQTLIPPTSTLHLVVTMTDLTGRTWGFPADGGTPAYDKTHRTVMRFSAQSQDGQFSGRYNGALAFAARCTSSFPGAFAPVSFHDFRDWLRARPFAKDKRRQFDPDQLATEFFTDYPDRGRGASRTHFVDGGVLDNAPFDHAIDVISRQAADRQVDRRIVYLEPDPKDVTVAGGTKSRRNEPSWLGTLLSVQRTVRGHQDLLNEIRRVSEINERIEDIKDITERHMTGAEEQVRADLKVNPPPTKSQSQQEVREWLRQRSDAMHSLAADRSGPFADTYRQLKLRNAVRAIATQAAERYSYPPDSAHLSQIERGLQLWVAEQKEAQAQIELLRDVDLPFRERRLQFLLAGLNMLYAKQAPTRGELDTCKKALWEVLTELRNVARKAWHKDLDAAFGPDRLDALAHEKDEQAQQRWQETLGPLLEAHRRNLRTALDEFKMSERLWAIFGPVFQGPEQERWQAWFPLGTSYLAFPLFDMQVFPIMELSRLPQLSKIDVRRMSPIDAGAIEPLDEKGWPGKLRGTKWAHFSAFFNQSWRENDYLWGRLDATELILCMLRGQDDLTIGLSDPGLRAAVRSVLESEPKERLPGITELREDVRRQVAEAENQIAGRA